VFGCATRPETVGVCVRPLPPAIGCPVRSLPSRVAVARVRLRLRVAAVEIPRPAAMGAAGKPMGRTHHETDQIRKPGFAVYTVERDGDKAQ